jgi:hypothetical protein
MRHTNEAQLLSYNTIINTYYPIIKLDIGQLRSNLKEVKMYISKKYMRIKQDYLASDTVQRMRPFII